MTCHVSTGEFLSPYLWWAVSEFGDEQAGSVMRCRSSPVSTRVREVLFVNTSSVYPLPNSV